MNSGRLLAIGLGLLCLMMGLGTGMNTLRVFRAHQLSHTMTNFGRLPEFPIGWVDYLSAVCAALLLIAAMLAFLRKPLAGPIALAATTALWLFYGPALWAHLTGDGWFETTQGSTTRVPWNQFAWLISTMVCAAWATWVWFRPSSSQ